ncbi:hypothetical protein XENOCAPTIV_030970 [Xenoophorus captivus]|uniref:Uncharacterized protein n=1 Tax=Xenoophorus captivus TaxID=1517983 RepID=A0ABV0SE35_9TELE
MTLCVWNQSNSLNSFKKTKRSLRRSATSDGTNIASLSRQTKRETHPPSIRVKVRISNLSLFSPSGLDMWETIFLRLSFYSVAFIHVFGLRGWGGRQSSLVPVPAGCAITNRPQWP